jgi:hypothetical protein
VSPRLIASAILGLALSCSAALAGPTYTFSLNQTAVPQFPAGGVGTVTLTQVSATQVGVLVDLNSGFGFLNTGGPHTPFTFNLSGSGGLTATFTTPTNGTYASGTFSLNTAGGSNTPYGTFGVAIDSSANNGSGAAYYGDLAFTLTRASGLDTTSFIQNGSGAYFAADITNGTNTGAVAATTRNTPTTVPEPMSLALVGTGLVAFGLLRRRKPAA